MCTSPLKGFLNGLTENGKKNLIITPYTVDHIEFDASGNRYNVSDAMHFHPDVLTDWIEIPCGQCIECRLQRSRQWADRCMLELQYHQQSWFVTLTYDDDHLPKSDEFIDPVTGEFYRNATLVKNDLSAFMKRLRRAYEYAGHDNSIRFYGCGEYGSQTLRPHFHVILFGLELPPDDLTLYRVNFNGDILYNSKFLSKVWKNGHVVLGEVTWQSCAYVARYIMKKHLGKDSVFYDDYGIEPEFTLMSRRPGIAAQYYADHKDEIFSNDYVTIPTHQGAKKIYPPRYFEKLYEDDNPAESCVRKAKRQQAAIDNKSLILSNTSQNYLDYLVTKAYNIEKRIETLRRPDI